MSTVDEKILVVGPSWVGDMVMSQSLYIFLQNTRQNLSIDVLAPAWSEPLLARMPQVNKALTLPVGHDELGLGRRFKLGRKLRPLNYDQAILLPNSFKSALVPFFAGIKKRTGWRGEMRYGLLNDVRHLDQDSLPLMVQRFVALGQAPDVPVPEQLPPPQLLANKDEAMHCAEKFDLDMSRPILALCPGAEFGAAKRWPAQYYAEIANEYLAQGWQVALYGSAKDQPVTGEIYAATGAHVACADLAGRTSLAEVVDLLSLSRAVVSNDSGLMHIAAALQRPVVVIYGATSPGFTPPLCPDSEMLVSNIECAPCFERECPLGHHRCMRDARPAQLEEKLEALLARSNPA
ncbi:MAG: lipopolysaccharide heptosyltransferase II [Halioglobus sp.]